MGAPLHASRPTIEFSTFETAWGTFGYVGRGDWLVATFLPASRRSMLRTIADRYPQAIEAKDLLPRFRRDVTAYFEGRATEFTVKVDLSAVPPFHRLVLEACRRVGHGRTASYRDLARATGKPGAARAVGGAMARNPLPLVVPCHRVLRSDGSLGGFSSPDGIGEKLRLLRLENPRFTSVAMLANLVPIGRRVDRVSTTCGPPRSKHRRREVVARVR